MSLESLERMFKWEFRICILASIAIITNSISVALDNRVLDKVAFGLGAACILPVLVIDFVVSVQLTMIFLLPIKETLEMTMGTVHNKSLMKVRKTKWSTLIGVFPPPLLLICHLP